MSTQDTTEYPKITRKSYRCSQCGHVQSIETNHTGKVYSLGRYLACPKCPPFRKCPWLGGTTTWEFVGN